jgi:hypothetical protein
MHCGLVGELVQEGHSSDIVADVTLDNRRRSRGRGVVALVAGRRRTARGRVLLTAVGGLARRALAVSRLAGVIVLLRVGLLTVRGLTADGVSARKAPL